MSSEDQTHSAECPRCHFKGKLVVVGQSGVGKTSIVYSLTHNQFDSKQQPSIGVAFSQKSIQLSKSTVAFDIWDTAGQERFRSINSLYYRNAATAVIVYDITNMDSFKTVKEYWLKQIKSYCTHRDIILALAGNKSDMESTREVSKKEAQEFASENNMIFMETAAPIGSNVQDLFVEIAKTVPRKMATEGDDCGFQVVKIDSQLSLFDTHRSSRTGCKC
eukprot:TRINITY_DN402_c0_g1_i1.p1 TRINITY_DN402_c0_g1~~TRINITY_DN402_c0_g1_i1.p1  ORF type:complete len:219 (-),score=47.20 TRINITY_DN402_c0_g1_i1:176-832(-)